MAAFGPFMKTLDQTIRHQWNNQSSLSLMVHVTLFDMQMTDSQSTRN